MLTYQHPQMKYWRNMKAESLTLSAVCMVVKMRTSELTGCGMTSQGFRGLGAIVGGVENPRGIGAGTPPDTVKAYLAEPAALARMIS
jgi:hypothetical protein